MNIMVLPFDTLQYAKKLQQVGFTEQQAEVQAETFKEHVEFINDWIDNNLTTKRDLKEVEERLITRINDLANQMNELNYKMTIRLGSMIVGAVIVLGVLMPIMLKFLGR